MDTFMVLENYRLCEKIEEHFAVEKEGLDGARPRTWYPDNLRGRQFVQFVSLGYHCFLIKKIKEMRAELGKIGAAEKPRRLSCSKRSWTSGLSNDHLLRFLIGSTDWFDCIETTQIKTAMDTYRWSTESVARDCLFLDYLGVTS